MRRASIDAAHAYFAVNRVERQMTRVAIVTGGTRGIGEAISTRLRNAGYKVAAGYGGDAAKAAAFADTTGIPTWKWDVGDFKACTAAVREIEASLGSVDILVNNAGITRD